jgi:hypothetical protein
MRKFKIKNRQKRKYTRKLHATPYIIFPKTVFLGLILSLFISIALFTTMMMNVKISQVIPYGILPSIYSTLSHSFQKSSNALSQTIMSLKIYKAPSIKPITFDFPSIKTNALDEAIVSVQNVIQNIMKGIITFSQNVSQTATKIFDSGATLLSRLSSNLVKSVINISLLVINNLRSACNILATNIYNSIVQSSQYLLEIFIFIKNQTRMTLTNISQATISFIQIFMKFVLTCIRTVVTAVNFTVRELLACLSDQISRTMTNIDKGIQLYFKLFNQILLTCVNGIITVYNFITIKCITALIQFTNATIRVINTILYFLGTPFRAIKNEYDKCKPFLNLIGTYLQRSTENLLKNWQDDFKIPEYLTKTK